MSDMDREGHTYASRTAEFENLTWAQLETAFAAVLADARVAATRLGQLEQTWAQHKPRLPDVLMTTRVDAFFDLCHDNEVGYYYTVRDIPALYEAAKASPHLWRRVQAVVTALHRYHQDTTQAADKIGLTTAYQETAAHQQSLVDVANAILRRPATSRAVLIAKARVLVASRGLDLTQDPWSLWPLDERALLVLVQDLLEDASAPGAGRS
ncbi:hypothetical protein [Microvirga guangxiensis]|uniref:Uncharacterized protein n=1 Tax=Microvirga guangxiensis TaxID=549386 RepID=A0A1G5KE47_9HYPH|nr:hypothetical protein [Microvirga guangxiensis]SCY98694.1 hypothetical protein SAMN02927923_03242 [Microvirga guangxiensis]